MDMDKAEVAKHALKFLETIGIDPRSLMSDADDRFTVSDTKTLKIGRKLIPPLTKKVSEKNYLAMFFLLS